MPVNAHADRKNFTLDVALPQIKRNKPFRVHVVWSHDAAPSQYAILSGFRVISGYPPKKWNDSVKVTPDNPTATCTLKQTGHVSRRRLIKYAVKFKPAAGSARTDDPVLDERP
ncbi:MAG: hypothetical protein OEM62_06025 [Acidobacteriota bacterium]|nr:hypothetical protein [Acidobacteriota bacterium]